MSINYYIHYIIRDGSSACSRTVNSFMYRSYRQKENRKNLIQL